MNITSIKAKIILLAIVAPLCFGLDQWSKWLAFENGENFCEWLTLFVPAIQNFTSTEILPFFNIVKIWNFGISFGMFSQDTDIGRIILISIASLVSIGFVVWMMRTNIQLIIIAVPMLVGGAIGNIWDRTRFNAVADFLDFHAYGFHYPAFNLADSFVFIAIALIIFDSLFLEKKREASLKDKNNDE